MEWGGPGSTSRQKGQCLLLEGLSVSALKRCLLSMFSASSCSDTNSQVPSCVQALNLGTGEIKACLVGRTAEHWTVRRCHSVEPTMTQKGKLSLRAGS